MVKTLKIVAINIRNLKLNSKAEDIWLKSEVPGWFK